MHISTDYPFSNRAAIYGDGCFTTIAVEHGKAELLARHIERLQHGCIRLNIELSASDWLKLKNKINESARTQQAAIIKVIITAGSGGRGYCRGPDCQPQCYLQTLPSVHHYEELKKSGISLGISLVKLSRQQSLAGIKHLNRLEQVLIKEHRTEISDATLQDDIVLDEEDIVVEVSAGNIFWCAYGRWFTPELQYSGVEGVMRNWIIECFAQNNIPVNRVRNKLSALKSASDVFICNSLMKMIPVNSIWFAGNHQISFKNSQVALLATLVKEAIKRESE